MLKIFAGIIIVAGGWFLMEGFRADPAMNTTTLVGAGLTVFGAAVSFAAYRPDKNKDNE